jgi:hypothetical protein
VTLRDVALSLSLPGSDKAPVEIVRHADKGEVCEGLREVPEKLSLQAQLLGVKPQMVRILVDKCFIFPFQSQGIPRPPIGDAADVEMNTENGGGEESGRRDH